MSAINWIADTAHSEIGFKIRHMMITNVSGRFNAFEVSATADERFGSPQIRFTAQADSIDTGSTDRDNHLKSPDFFDAAQFPQLVFESTAFTQKGDDEYELTGNLTMHGATHPVTLKVEFAGIGQDPWGNTKAGFSINGKLNRKDWGLGWNAALEAGGVLVGEEVKIHAEIQMIKKS